ncbi:response regulator transcription factor [Paracoccaceae bacterium Fryx2]|nr:response regulator transcription factor [Paracoccaceae bacterium Fryx2]
MKTSGCGKPVLISDDNEYFPVALHTILTDRLGASEVLETASFENAVECLANHPELALAIFALDMPGMNNWIDLRTVRHLFPHVRVAVVSASRERNDILMSLESGVHGYVSKAVSVDELSAALRHVINGLVYVPSFFPDLPVCTKPEKHLACAADERVGPKRPRVTPRQKEIIELLVAGKSNKAMARALDLSEGTIKFHLSSAFRLLSATNRVEAATAGARLLDEISA